MTPCSRQSRQHAAPCTRRRWRNPVSRPWRIDRSIEESDRVVDLSCIRFSCVEQSARHGDSSIESNLLGFPRAPLAPNERRCGGTRTHTTRRQDAHAPPDQLTSLCFSPTNHDRWSFGFRGPRDPVRRKISKKIQHQRQTTENTHFGGGKTRMSFHGQGNRLGGPATTSAAPAAAPGYATSDLRSIPMAEVVSGPPGAAGSSSAQQASVPNAQVRADASVSAGCVPVDAQSLTVRSLLLTHPPPEIDSIPNFQRWPTRCGRHRRSRCRSPSL